MLDAIRHSSSTVCATDFCFIRKLAKQNYVGYGELCKELERRLAEGCGRAAAILTGSGEGALALALHRLKSVNPGKEEVIISSYVCPSVVNAILSGGLRPVFADIAPDSLNLGLDDVRERRLTQDTLAIVCTHIGGLPDDIYSATQLGVPVISDCAQALGSGIGGRSLLALGDISITSFGPTKFLTGGLGGAVLCATQDEEAIRRSATPELAVADYRENGFEQTLGQHVSELNAGLVLAQLEHLAGFVQKRRRIAQRYDKALTSVPGVSLPGKVSAAEPNYFRYYFFSDRAIEWQHCLAQAGIDARTSISHRVSEYFPDDGTRPVLARQAQRVVSIPIYPGLKAAQVARIFDTLQCIALERMGAA